MNHTITTVSLAGLALAVLMTLGPATERAAAQNPDELRERARALFEEAEELESAARQDEAREHIRMAERLVDEAAAHDRGGEQDYGEARHHRQGDGHRYAAHGHGAGHGKSASHGHARRGHQGDGDHGKARRAHGKGHDKGHGKRAGQGRGHGEPHGLGQRQAWKLELGAQGQPLAMKLELEARGHRQTRQHGQGQRQAWAHGRRRGHPGHGGPGHGRPGYRGGRAHHGEHGERGHGDAAAGHRRDRHASRPPERGPRGKGRERVQHLREAAKHLAAAGEGGLAKQVMRKAEEAERDARKHVRARIVHFLKTMRDMRRDIDRLSQEIKKIRNHIERSEDPDREDEE